MKIKKDNDRLFLEGLGDLELFTEMLVSYKFYSKPYKEENRIHYAKMCKFYHMEIVRRNLENKYKAFKILIEEMSINV